MGEKKNAVLKTEKVIKTEALVFQCNPKACDVKFGAFLYTRKEDSVLTLKNTQGEIVVKEISQAK